MEHFCAPGRRAPDDRPAQRCHRQHLLDYGPLRPRAVSQSAYHAVKGAPVNLTQAWALEWAPHGIRVNAVAPAFTKTGLIKPFLSDAEMASAILAATPRGWLVEPEEVASAVLFLASDWASMITGHTLAVDGAGWHGEWGSRVASRRRPRRTLPPHAKHPAALQSRYDVQT
jgi:NAD(P)-dependent dehydrogenase (short-subunit alcohol dehydrogenase family)